MSRKIVRAIAIKDNKIAVIKRIKKDRTYYVFPGGGVEEGETFKEAIIREIKEELGVFVKVYGEIYKVLNLGELNTFMLCEIIEGDFGQGDGPEFNDLGYKGRGEYIPLLINIEEIKNINIFPEEIKDNLISEFEILDIEQMKNKIIKKGESY